MNRPDDRLDSWKEIAAYLGRGVTTVQRWEQDERLPVHRLPHARRGSVFAFKHELDAWRSGRTQSRSGGGMRIAAAGAAGLILLGLGSVWTLTRVRWSRDTAASVVAPMPKPLANDAQSETGPSLSPDGSRVVFRWWRDDAPGLYVKPIAGGEATRLPLQDAARFGAAAHPKWSPRGDLIAFLLLETPDTRGLYVVPTSGGMPKRVTTVAGIGLCWAPDGRTLGFADRTPGEPFSIFSISLDTGLRERLTTPGPGTFGDTHCAFSPSGQRLAVARYDSRDQSDLFVSERRADGSESLVRLTHDFSWGVQGLAWMPESDAVVVGSHNGLWLVPASANGSTPPRMVAAAGHLTALPTLARDGAGRSRLAFQYSVHDANIWRWHAQPGTSGTATRVGASTWFENHPAYSADGRRIAFASNRTGQNEIWTIDADGSNPRQVTSHGGPVVVSPQWSPDGSRLAFSSQATGNRDIYTIRPDGSQQVRLTSESSQEDNPSWSLDGRWIYFRSDRSGIAQIWRVPSSGGDPVQVTKGEASEGFESPDGRLLYFVRRMELPGLWSIPVGGGDETFVLADVSEAFWGVADTGIAFVVSAQTTTPGPEVRLFDFATRRVSTLVTLPGSRAVQPGFAISRDGRSLLWTRFDTTQDDLMLIDPWME